MLSYINKVKIIKNNFYYYFLNNKNKNFIYNYIAFYNRYPILSIHTANFAICIFLRNIFLRAK